MSKTLQLIIMDAIFFFIGFGCDTPDRVSRLERENKDLQAQIARVNATADYDLKAKCSKDARAWFNMNWGGNKDEDTILLDFTNHYNKKENRCFVFVEYHYNSHLAGNGGSSWTNHLSLWDVYENLQYADFAETSYSYPQATDNNDRKEVGTCEVFGQKCKSADEFNNLSRHFVVD